MPDFAPLNAALRTIQNQIGKVVVGRDSLVEQLLICVLAEGHCLLEGPAGSARSWTAEALAKTLGLKFRRVGCTPDLTPNEVVGLAGNTNRGGEPLPASPINSHLVLVDGIDRLQPQTRALFEEAMQSGQIHLDGRCIELPRPLMIMAAKYRTTEEQADAAEEPRADRFFGKLLFPYPTYHDEYQLANADATPSDVEFSPVLDAESILQWQHDVREASAPEHVVHYALRLVRATRVHEGENPDFVYEWVAAGAGSRAARNLLQAARIRAALRGRTRATSDDVRELAHCILRHRVVVNHNALSNGVTPDQVIDRLLYEIPERISNDDQLPTPGEAPEFDIVSDMDLL